MPHSSNLTVVNEDDKIFLIRVGKNISNERTLQKLTKVQLAFEINTSESNIRRIEKGEINIGILTLKKISEALNVPIHELLSMENSNE